MALQQEVLVRLDSWKDIASYLNRDVRTVMRWEKSRGLPVRRIPGEARSTVYALKTEIDAWLLGHSEVVDETDEETLVPPAPNGRSDSELAKVERDAAAPLLRHRHRWQYVTVGALVATAYIAFLLSAGPWRYTQALSVANPERITQSQVRVLSPLLIQGSNLYFPQYDNNRYSMASVPAGGGQTANVATTVPNPDICDLAVHSRSMLLRSVVRYRDDAGPLYIQSPQGVARRVGSVSALDAVWYPDERRILFSLDQSIFVTDQAGTSPKRLFSVPGSPFWFRWSRDGKALRFTVLDKTNTTSIWEASVDGSEPHRLLSELSNPVCCGTWTPDGAYFLFQYRIGGAFQIWAQHESDSFPEFTKSRPFPLLTGAMNYRGAAVAPDGRRLYLRADSTKAELVRLDQTSGKFSPFLPSLPIRTVAFSNDGAQLAYTSLSDNQLWRCNVDGEQWVQLTKGLRQSIMPRWSPDGQSIAFMGLYETGGWTVFVVPTQGGALRPLSGNARPQGDPDWSPDSRSIIFGDVLPVSEHGGIHVLDLVTNQIKPLPGSNDFVSPRWSPDGRSIVAVHISDQHLYIFDFVRAKWSELTRNSGGYPSWSHDGKWVYYLATDNKDRAIFRTAPGRAGSERVASLDSVRKGSFFMSDWTGLTPDGAVLALDDLTAEDIYAWDLIHGSKR